QPKQREAHRHLSSKVHRRNLNMVARQHENCANVQLPTKVVDKFRRRVALEDLRLNSLVRSLVVQRNEGRAPAGHRLNSVNQSRRHLVGHLPVKRVAKEKECSASTLSSSNNNSSVVDRLLEQDKGRDRGRRSQKVARESMRKERHRQGHNSSNIITAAAPKREVPGPLSL